jgi:uncharacterized repeat protein (TIGR03803 family)
VTPVGAVATLYSFKDGADGKNPQNGVIEAIDGNFYGTTTWGGTHACGTAYRITPTGILTTIYEFTGGDDGSQPNNIIQAFDGNLYGTTTRNGAKGNYGTVFRLTTSGVLTTLHSFSNKGLDGACPVGSLVQDAGGTIYGTTTIGGAHGKGTVFTLTPFDVPIP